jgi:hypothetical protein
MGLVEVRGEKWGLEGLRCEVVLERKIAVYYCVDRECIN